MIKNISFIFAKKQIIKKNDSQGEFAKGEGNPQPIYIYFFKG